MAPETCDLIAERLVDYADRELSPAEAAGVAEHVAACPACRRRLAALRQSLAAAQGVWQSVVDEVRPTGPTTASRRRSARRWLPRVGVAVTAAATLLFAVARFGRTPETAPVKPVAMTAAQVEREIQDAGAAQAMLLVGDQLAETPGGRPYAEARFYYITEHYPATSAAAEARARLAALTERG
ncbi:MAG: zf-HC2 domain-containing protein [Phycisphaerae bacterium]|nr:zf-HC2 domain-containing protein [Phycisphaerae bacterium]